MSITIALIALTGLISYQAFENGALKANLILHPFTMKREKQWYRFLTSGLIHADWNHLLINMFVLYMFGEEIEFYFDQVFSGGLGRLVYLLLYLSAIIISSIPTYFKHQDNSFYSALGASGATSALVMVSVFFAPWRWFIIPPLPAILFAVGYLWYSSYMAKNSRDNIGHEAHYWGAVYGVAFILSIAFFYESEIDLIQLFLYQFLQGPSLPNFGGM